jgi:hypothetical protein
MNAMWNILTYARISSMSPRFRLFDSLVRSVLTYAAPIWSLRYFSEVERVQSIFIRRILLVNKCTPDYILRLECGRINLKVFLFKQLLLFWQKILIMDETRLPRKCYDNLVKFIDTTSPLYNWALQVRNLLGSLGYLYVWESQSAEAIKSHMPQLLERYIDICRTDDISRAMSSLRFPWYKH